MQYRIEEKSTSKKTPKPAVFALEAARGDVRYVSTRSIRLTRPTSAYLRESGA
jgi:hypothetical protein